MKKKRDINNKKELEKEFTIFGPDFVLAIVGYNFCQFKIWLSYTLSHLEYA